MTQDSVRLNYTISDLTDSQLTSYCELTGRSASDLVRQLVSEVLEDDRRLPSPEIISRFLQGSGRRDRRTDMWMSARYLSALDEKLETEGHTSKSCVIAYLLHEFLNSRANHAAEEMVRITTLVDRVTFTKLASVAGQRQQQVEGLVADLCGKFVNQDGERH